MNPIIHSQNSIKRWGGTLEDYLPIHKKMDCSKTVFADNRHRALTHTHFWITEVMIPIFGDYIELTNKKKVSVKDICEKHILEDYGMNFIPTPGDFLMEMESQDWMQNSKNNTFPPSAKKTQIAKKYEIFRESKRVE